ncbi:unnamed protein product [Ranitomeya imitator]|uniref:non-specific serine/threonine protein kinase n=1 Tax=Ranitomeya imitator TaxID=111125 RepID=A0ABN9MBJ2_9NEOB|nr:unnamed protein product [Ranitomeya imitator]
MHLLFGLEYVSCGDFYSYLLMKGQLAIPSASFYAAELVCGIQYLHSKGIIHRETSSPRTSWWLKRAILRSQISVSQLTTCMETEQPLDMLEHKATWLLK